MGASEELSSGATQEEEAARRRAEEVKPMLRRLHPVVWSSDSGNCFEVLDMAWQEAKAAAEKERSCPTTAGRRFEWRTRMALNPAD